MASLAVFSLLLNLAYAIDPRVAAIISERHAKLAPLLIAQRSSRCPQINVAGGSTPGVSYYNGQEGGCPIIHALDADKTCTSSMTINSGVCSGYCEVRNYFFYGKEVPFAPLAHCSADEPCSIQASQSATITQTFEFNVGAGLNSKRSEEDPFLAEREEKISPEAVLKGAFDIGASYSWSTAKTTLTGLTESRPTNNNASDCGYWTTVPIFWTSCGTMTTAPTAPGNAGSGNIFKRGDNEGCVNTKTTTTSNYCNTTPYLDTNGKNAGIQLFVVTGCHSGKLQPVDMQDPIFAYPGVAATAFQTEFQT